MKVTRDEWFATFGFVAALTLTLLLAAWVGGCGGDAVEASPRRLSVDITCDYPVAKPRCSVIVYGADEVEAYYNGRIGWWDRDITNERNVYVDSPPAGEFVVVACNEVGCVEDILTIDFVAQVDPDDDPLVECIDPAPDCEYGRRPVCHEGKWYCAADHRRFRETMA